MTERPQTSTKWPSSDHDPLSDGWRLVDECTVWITNLPADLHSKLQVRLAFDLMFGAVAHVHIKRDLSHGFVHFENAASAVAALGTLEPVLVCGKPVQIRPALAKGGINSNEAAICASVQFSLPKPKPGSSLLSVGSEGHWEGTCKPCMHFHKPGGCHMESECTFCHHCEEGEFHRRRIAKKNSLIQQSTREKRLCDRPLPERLTHAQTHPEEDVLEATHEFARNKHPNQQDSSWNPRFCEFRGSAARAMANLEEETLGASDQGIIWDPEPKAYPRPPATLAQRVSQPQEFPGGRAPAAFIPKCTKQEHVASEQRRVSQQATSAKAATTTSLQKGKGALLPSVGSVGHEAGTCKPCLDFLTKVGCTRGVRCHLCHLCERSDVERSMKKRGALPSVGSKSHKAGFCKPCFNFLTPAGCSNGALCKLCHLCEKEDVERRLKKRKKGEDTPK